MRRLLALLWALPAESQLRAELGGYDRDSGPWTEQLELLAKLVEVCSVIAADGYAYRKPLTLPRPDYLAKLRAGGKRVADAQAPADAARAMLAGRRLRVVS